MNLIPHAPKLPIPVETYTELFMVGSIALMAALATRSKLGKAMLAPEKAPKKLPN
jgi:hypothetical protein